MNRRNTSPLNSRKTSPLEDMQNSIGKLRNPGIGSGDSDVPKCWLNHNGVSAEDTLCAE
jgi:hypothetical protein